MSELLLKSKKKIEEEQETCRRAQGKLKKARKGVTKKDSYETEKKSVTEMSKHKEKKQYQKDM